jgi:hypothetical protein
VQEKQKEIDKLAVETNCLTGKWMLKIKPIYIGTPISLFPSAKIQAKFKARHIIANHVVSPLLLSSSLHP